MQGRKDRDKLETDMDWTLRSGKEQEMPSQPQGLGSVGFQVVSRWLLPLKESLSSSNACPARSRKNTTTPVRQPDWRKHSLIHPSIHGCVVQRREREGTVRGEGHGGGAEQWGSHGGDEGGAQAHHLPRSPMAAAARRLHLLHLVACAVHGGLGLVSLSRV